MTRCFAAILLWTFSALAALATCQGTDLRATLTEAERTHLTEQLDATPYNSGNHWRATKDGNVLHLVGTIHLGDPRLDPVIERLRPVIDDAGLLLLEATAEERLKLQDSIVSESDIFFLPGKSLIDLLPEDDWAQLKAALAARGMPAFMAARYQPWFLAVSLAMPPCLAQEAAKANGLDALMEARAAAQDIPVAALEDFDAGIRSFAGLSFEDQVSMLKATLMESQDAEDQFATLFAAYFEEAHAEVWLISEILSARVLAEQRQQREDGMLVMVIDAPSMSEIESALLVKRNEAWINVIEDAALENDKPVVAAFGAAHLAGTSGILNLLADRGWALEQLPF